MSGHASFEEAHCCLVVWFLLELERPAVFHELLELSREAYAKVFKWRLHLLLLDRVVLLILASAGEALPRKRSFQQVEQHMSDCFQVVTSRLLDALVSGDGSIPRCSGQVLPIFVRNVLALTVLVAFRKTEVNDIYIISGVLSGAD